MTAATESPHPGVPPVPVEPSVRTGRPNEGALRDFPSYTFKEKGHRHRAVSRRDARFRTLPAAAAL